MFSFIAQSKDLQLDIISASAPGAEVKLRDANHELNEEKRKSARRKEYVCPPSYHKHTSKAVAGNPEIDALLYPFKGSPPNMDTYNFHFSFIVANLTTPVQLP